MGYETYLQFLPRQLSGLLIDLRGAAVVRQRKVHRPARNGANLSIHPCRTSRPGANSVRHQRVRAPPHAAPASIHNVHKARGHLRFLQTHPSSFQASSMATRFRHSTSLPTDSTNSLPPTLLPHFSSPTPRLTHLCDSLFARSRSRAAARPVRARSISRPTAPGPRRARGRSARRTGSGRELVKGMRVQHAPVVILGQRRSASRAARGGEAVMNDVLSDCSESQ